MTATSGTTLSYQWYFGSTVLNGAVNSNLTVQGVTANNTGAYYVAVRNASGTVNSRWANLTVTISPPVANSQSATMPENCATNLVLTATDAGGRTLTYSIVSGPSHGNLTGLNPNTGAVTYTPATNYYGNDAFTFAASDGSLNGTAQVSLTILRPPSVSGLWATNINVSSAVLNGTVDTHGLPATSHFLYGLTASYDSSTAIIPPGSSPVAFSISNLTSGTAYHFCLVASNAAGVTYSQDATFTTTVGPPSGSTLSATSITISSATLNAQVNQQIVSLTCYFQYGLTTNYGSVSSSVLLPGILTLGGLLPVSVPIAELTPGTIYHYRLVVTGLGGTTYGQDASFATLSVPPMQVAAGLSTWGENPAGYMQLNLTSSPGATFTVLCSTNFGNWTAIGTMAEFSPGQYQFTDPTPATNPACFYRIRSP